MSHAEFVNMRSRLSNSHPPERSDADRTEHDATAAESDHAWWRRKLEAARQHLDGEAFHEFTTDHRRPAMPGGVGEPIADRLSATVGAALTNLANSQGVELCAVLLTLLSAEVARREGRRSLIIGSGVPGGALVPVLLTADRPQPLAERVRATQSALNEAAAHAGCPSALLCQEFRPTRSSLFDIALRGTPHPPADIDLDFCYEPAESDPGALNLTLFWNPDVYALTTAHKWLSRFVAWARWLAEDVRRANEPAPVLLPEEEQLLTKWEQGPVRPRPRKRFHQLFEAVVDRDPHRPAVIASDGVETYAELDRRANRIARALLDLGVTREEPVAVLTECSTDLPAVVLGIWKAGAAYVPLALDQPPARLVHMTADSGAKTLIVLDGRAVPPPLAEAIQNVLRPEALLPGNGEERPDIAGTAYDLAYLVYTSGTTGAPKGVPIQHDSLINAASISGEAFGLTPEDRFALVATPGFDASLWELGASLLHGMALVPVSQALRDDPWALTKWYERNGVTVAFHAPSYLRTAKSPFEGLRILIAGGEAPDHELARCYSGRLAFWNAYGPTETCIFVCAEQIHADADTSHPLPVGRPLANTRISIRRENGDLVPPGVLGEVWLGGVGLARGYLNNPDLTAQRFVETPGGRFYRTGDLGRWTEDGLLELAGRIDHQIKLHGQRMELGEVEQVLRSHAAVEEAAVLVETSAHDTKALRAFVRLRAGADVPDEDEWRAYLSQQLPAYMVPASVLPVPAIPLNASGKIDRDALRFAASQRNAGNRLNPPTGEWETRIAANWSELLGCAVSRDDNFFALGGNSLLAVTMAHRLSQELGRPVPARALFAAPTLAGFAQRLQGPPQMAPAQPPARSDLATESQREFWTAEAAGLDTRTFTMPVIRAVEGPVPDFTRWNAAWAALVARHESLRTCFREDEQGHLRCVVVPEFAAALEAHSHQDMPSARSFIRQRQAVPFRMGVPPLWRAGLVEVAESCHHLFWMALHHSLGDGQSIGIILEELAALLRGEVLPPLDQTFSEAAAREEAYLREGACQDDERYWRALLARQSAECFEEMPLDFARSAHVGTGNHRLEARLDARTAAGLRSIAREHAASLHAVMLTLLALEAWRRTGREEFVIGTTASTRETGAEVKVVGCYVNMLPVPCRVRRDVAFGEALAETQQALAGALQHARYPFARMYRDFWNQHPGQRHPARYPLFDLAVTENPAMPPARASLRFVRLTPSEGYERTEASPGLDMVLVHEDLPDGGVRFEWQVNAALYSRETAANWLESLCAWAGWLAEDRQRSREAMPALLPSEAALIERWERGAAVTRPSVRFHELFERTIDRDAGQCDRPAVVTQAGMRTYAALDRDANTIAHALIERGATRGAVVALLTGRSANLPAAVLGIWKAGATYLPLAADLPEERLRWIARDAGAAYLISLDGLTVPPALAGDLPLALRPEQLDSEFRRTHTHRPAVSGHPSDAAYIIYTSGSTGQPKGVQVCHGAYVNSVLGVGEMLSMTCDDRSLMFSSPSFDVSLSDIGLPLAFGASLCPVPHEVLSSPTRFRDLLAGLAVTVADITPSYLRLFDGASLPSLRVLVTGGEAPFGADVKTYASRHQYFNAYGPTENAITSTMKRLSPTDHGKLCGRPLPNTSACICDAKGKRLPPGAVGELWLGGAGLATGYVGRPDLTSSAFVESPDGRRYRSGDLARWAPNGDIEILGRADDQVKLNGIRIELAEIEQALAGHPDVTQAVAFLDTDEGRRHSLWAFVRLAEGRDAPDEESWHTYLGSQLPAYMIPSGVITLPEIPVNNSGKVDRAALRKLLIGRSRGGDRVPPAGSLEAEIAKVWSELLGIGTIHLDDNFFSLGGHSLLAIASAHRLEEILGRPVPARELFVEPTLRGFAGRVVQLCSADTAADVFSDRATEGQQDFWIAERAGLDTRGYNLSLSLVAQNLLQGPTRWSRAWAALVARHNSLRTVFHEDSDGVLRRSVVERLDADLEFSTFPDLPAARTHIRDRQAKPFAMNRAPLWRAGLVSVHAQEQPVFWLTIHHSVADGISLATLFEELAAHLGEEALPAVAGSFDRSAGREQEYLSSAAAREDAVYWRDLLRGLGDGWPDRPQPFDEWALDFPRPKGRTTRNAKGAHCFHTRLDAGVAAGLRAFAQENGAGLHATMLTMMAHEVHRRSGRTEFLIGTLASTRDAASEARVVGYYVNMLPLAFRLHGGEPFEQLLSVTQRNLAEGLRHSRYPFSRIHRDFREDQGVALDAARHPLFDIAVTGNPAPQTATSIVAPFAHDAAGYELRVSAPFSDMLLVHEDQPDGSLVLQWIVDAAIYEKETAEDWFDALAGWSRFLARGERRSGSALPALLPEEEILLAGWEQGPVRPLPAPSLPARFEEWARLRPDCPALIAEEGARSYAAISARSNALAHALLALGVQRKEPIGVLTDRSASLPETVLAIWKAGGCYLPLVKDLPADRMSFMVRDAGIRVLLALDGCEPPGALAANGCQILRPESLSETFFATHTHSPQTAGGSPNGSELAYIIYTSGSTGMPKGVMLQHRGLMNLGMGMRADLHLRAEDRALLMASPAFDAWIADLAAAWTAGAAVVPILSGEMSDLAGMRDKIGRLGVTVATMTPAYLRLFERADFPTLRVLLTVGEPPNLDDARHYAKSVRYINGYGPTENTAAVGFGEVTVHSQYATAGRPLPNTSVHILDRGGDPAPPGVTGEVWLGGAGLAAGYLKRPDLTAAAFVETRAGRRYRTGDLGRWTRTGELRILGRSDGQVKLRGHRVELGEIEHWLGLHPSVQQGVAAVETLPEGTQTLWAFVRLHAGAAEPSQMVWRDYLARTLPSYMLPSAVVVVPAIPMNIACKVDRAALLRAASEWRSDNREASGRDHQGAEPCDSIERRVAEVWAEHLECGGIAREDDFFDLGGNSLRAISVVNQLRRGFNCSVNDLYEHPRLADFSALCRPRPAHLRDLIRSASRNWRAYQEELVAYETERDAELAAQRQDYEMRNRDYQRPMGTRTRDYRCVLLTGATGYLGNYLLCELIADPHREISVLIRAADEGAARARLLETLCYYFGPEKGAALLACPRLTVLAGDLRREDLGVPQRAYGELADTVQAVFHCAANVKHFGHYQEFHRDNVASTAHLLKLASHRPAGPADFHFVSTLSVSGKGPEKGFRLFTEYDTAPESLDDNYYVRSKQEAERLVERARQELANACIHRVGNLVYASEGGPLQFHIRDNAFFRLIAALLRLGVVPDDAHLWLCHVDSVARALVLLATAGELTNETHHIEHARRDTLAGFVTAASRVRACDFGGFLDRLEKAVDQPHMDAALTEVMDSFGLYRGLSPQGRARRMEIVSGRTQALLSGFGFAWPSVSGGAGKEMLREAAHFYSQPPLVDVARGASG